MDDLDIYGDLDDFHEQEEKKSKELLTLEAKYEEAVKVIEAMKLEKKDLRKKIRLMEKNLQSLLDTAKAELKRKDKIIEDLRKEKDDLCFRRQRAQHKPTTYKNDQRHIASTGLKYLNGLKKETCVDSNLNTDCSKNAEESCSSNFSNIDRKPNSDEKVRNPFREQLEDSKMTEASSVGNVQNTRNATADNIKTISDNEPTQNPFKSVGNPIEKLMDHKIIENSNNQSVQHSRNTNTIDTNSFSDKESCSQVTRNPFKCGASLSEHPKDDFKRNTHNIRDTNAIGVNSTIDEEQRSQAPRNPTNIKASPLEQLMEKYLPDVEKQNTQTHDIKTRSDKEVKKKYDNDSGTEKPKKRYDRQRESSEHNSKSPRSKDRSSERSSKVRYDEKHHSKGGKDHKHRADRSSCDEQHHSKGGKDHKDRAGKSSCDEKHHSKSGKDHKDRADRSSCDEIHHSKSGKYHKDRAGRSSERSSSLRYDEKHHSKSRKDHKDRADRSSYDEKYHSKSDKGDYRSNQKYEHKSRSRSHERYDKSERTSSYTNDSNSDKRKESRNHYENRKSNRKNDRSPVHRKEPTKARKRRRSQKHEEYQNKKHKHTAKFEDFKNEKSPDAQNKDLVLEESSFDDLDLLCTLNEAFLRKTAEEIKRQIENVTSMPDKEEVHEKSKERCDKNIHKDENCEKLEEYSKNKQIDKELSKESRFEGNSIENQTKNDTENVVPLNTSSKSPISLKARSSSPIQSTHKHDKSLEQQSISVCSIKLNSPLTGCSSVNGNVVETTDDTVENIDKNSSSMTKEIKTDNNPTETTSIGIPDSKTHSLFDALFGIPSTGTDVINGPLLGNLHEILDNSNTSSSTTSPDLYTDVSQTPSRNSPKIYQASPNKNGEMETVKDLPTVNNDELLSFSSNGKLNSLTALNESGKKCSNTLETAAENCDVPVSDDVDKVQKEAVEVEDNITLTGNQVESTERKNCNIATENLKTDAKTCVDNEGSEEVDHTNMDLNSAVSEKLDPDKSITEVTPKVEISNPEISVNLVENSGLSIDKVKAANSPSSEHALQNVCLVEISDDETTNMDTNLNAVNKLHDEKFSETESTSCSNKYLQQPADAECNFIEQGDLKEIKEQHSSLESKSKDASSITLEAVPEHTEESSKNPENVAEFKQPTDVATENIKENNVAMEADEVIEIITEVAKKNPDEIKAKHLPSNVDNNAVITLDDNEDESSVYNLIISSDDDDDDMTLAEIQKQCKLQKKQKIEILENIRLPTLAELSLRYARKSPKKCTDLTKAAEKGVVLEKSEPNASKVTKEPITIIDISEDSNNVDQESKHSDDLVILENVDDIVEGIEDINKTTLLTTDKIDNETTLNNNEISEEFTMQKSNEIQSKEIEIGTQFPVTESTIESIEVPAHNVEVTVKQNIPTFKQKSPLRKSKSPTKVVSEKSKQRRSLTEHNGKVLDAEVKQKAQNSTGEILTENIQNTTTPCKGNKKQLPLSASNEKKTPRRTLRPSTKKVASIPTPKGACKKSPLKAKTIRKSCKNNDAASLKISAKRKRSPSPCIINLIDDDTISNVKSTTKTIKTTQLSTSAEVKAMLIDGKSPQISNDMLIVTSPVNGAVHDTNLDQLDKDMQAIFQSPAKLELTDYLPCGNSTVLNVTIDETVNSQKLETSLGTENLNKSNDSSFESKRLSLGKTEYVYEQISENVVNLFISRKRGKKRTKLDATARNSL